MVCRLQIKRFLSILLAAVLLLGGGSLQSGWAKDRQAGQSAGMSDQFLGIQGIQVAPDGKSLVIEANRPFTGRETQNLSILRLPYPYRLLVEIPNAQLESSQKVFPINRHGIDRVELSDNRSRFYSSVRAVVYVQDGQVLTRLATAFEGNRLKLEGLPEVAMTADQVAASQSAPTPVANPLPPQVKPAPPVPVKLANAPQAEPVETVLDTPVAPGTNIVEEISYRDHQLVIKANEGARLKVKNRFMLTDPTRLVLDLDNAVLSNRALMAPIDGRSDDIRQIRVGQFDESTVRIVIGSPEPEQFEAIFVGADRSLMAISPYSQTSITKLAAHTQLGEVESIDLKRENNHTVLRLTASTPIVHRFIKRDGKVVLDLLNEASHPTAIGFDAKQYPEILKMNLEPLTEGQPNSKLSIQLASAAAQVTPSVLENGRVLELKITGDGLEGKFPFLSALGAAGKAPFPAKIVIDAGHGGKDKGANRSGVNEKDLNLSLALMLRDALEAKGFKVYMTRTTDQFLPLPEITAITNRIRPDLFISVHHNASVNTAVHGIETYYYTPQSLALAKRVHAREINAVGARDGGVKQAMFYVIHHTNVPAILCEVGYVSNPKELGDLQTMERKVRTARSIADGVVDYLKTRMSAKAN